MQYAARLWLDPPDRERTANSVCRVQVHAPILGVPFSVGRVLSVSQAEVVTTSGDRTAPACRSGFCGHASAGTRSNDCRRDIDYGDTDQPAPPTHFTEEFVMYRARPIEVVRLFASTFKLPRTMSRSPAASTICAKWPPRSIPPTTTIRSDQPVDESGSHQARTVSIGEPKRNKSQDGHDEDLTPRRPRSADQRQQD
jgi:hypothetical protein